jgi:hypothetical protein
VRGSRGLGADAGEENVVTAVTRTVLRVDSDSESAPAAYVVVAVDFEGGSKALMGRAFMSVVRSPTDRSM